MSYHLIRKVRVSVVAEGKPYRLEGQEGLLEKPSQVVALLKKWCPNDDKEHFFTILVDARHSPLGINVVSVGTLTASLVHPREVFRPAVVLGAAACLIAHNHPSGHVGPSPEDRSTTKRLKEAGDILGIQIMDHVIFSMANDSYTSFRENGWLDS